MILSIAFDTFVQQVLTTSVQPQDVKLTGGNLTSANILPSILSYNDNGAPNHYAEARQLTMNRRFCFRDFPRALATTDCGHERRDKDQHNAARCNLSHWWMSVACHPNDRCLQRVFTSRCHQSDLVE